MPETETKEVTGTAVCRARTAFDEKGGKISQAELIQRITWLIDATNEVTNTFLFEHFLAPDLKVVSQNINPDPEAKGEKLPPKSV